MTNRCASASQLHFSPVSIPCFWTIVWTMLGLLTWGNAMAAMACDGTPSPAAMASPAAAWPALNNAPEAAPPLHYGDLSQLERAALDQQVRDRQTALPYRFLGLPRCPSLGHQAIRAFDQGDYDQALAALGAVIAQQPGQAEPWLNRAMIYYYLGRDGEARSDAAAAYDLDRGNNRVEQAYRELFITLDGKLPDRRRAVEVYPPPVLPEP